MECVHKYANVGFNRGCLGYGFEMQEIRGSSQAVRFRGACCVPDGILNQFHDE